METVYTYDDNGNIVNQYTYDEWGNILTQTETVDNPVKYAGEYYDSETGLIYLRNRYYNPAIHRFIQSDPAEDGINWYVYCGNNPVMFVDRFGLKAVLVGSKEDMDAVVAQMMTLSRDTITVDYETGVLSYSDENPRRILGDRSVGTSLVRNIIDNDKTTTISVQEGSSLFPSNFSTALSKDAFTMGVGSDTIIKIDLSNPIKLLTEGKESSEYTNTPYYIILGHELIHTLRAMNGNLKGSETGRQTYRDPATGRLRTDTARREELEATGINYSYVLNGQTIFVGANSWAISENALRREHGLAERVKY